LDLDQLKAFIMVARYRNITRAGEALNLSSPALGYKIRQLESWLGTDLLVRHSRGVSLTEAGAVFLEHAELISQAIANARADVSAKVGKRPKTLSVGLIPTAAHIYGAALLLSEWRCGQAYAVREGGSLDLSAAVTEGSLDAAICFEGCGAPPARSTRLSEHSLFLIGAPEVVGKEPEISFRDLPGIPVVMDAQASGPRQHLEAVSTAMNVMVNIELELNPGSLRRAMLVTQGRCAIAPIATFAEDIAAGHLAGRRIVGPEVAMNLNVIFRSDLSLSAEVTMLGLLRQALG
jgi:LysR family nitrogen assimilation transcriptional regulator